MSTITRNGGEAETVPGSNEILPYYQRRRGVVNKEKKDKVSVLHGTGRLGAFEALAYFVS